MEKKIKEDIVFDGKLIKVIQRKILVNDTKESFREIVLHPGAVGIIPITKEKNLILVKQFRSPLEKILLEIPAGKLKKGEDPLECAKRELLEETGFSGDFEKIGSFASSPGFSNEIIHIFLCKNSYFVSDKFKHEGEIEKVVFLTIEEAYKLILKGEIEDLKTAFSILYAYENIRSI
ncbi:MAG: NUDIX hydrolase [Caldisericia bacterium]|jgi:ADP-ribose pyrophosphatase|nr:NUDIX hydrolase [Caldisericia bacterium]